MRIERPEISAFIPSWQGKSKKQVVEELASYSLETKRIPDPYYYLITQNGELYSPTAHCRIRDSVEDKTGPLGSLEYRAVVLIEQWAAGNQEGAAIWVSPPYPGVYPVSKIIISQIEYLDGVKRLFNRAIILDYDEKKCLEFAQNLAQLSQNRPEFSNLDSVRAAPLIFKTHGDSWAFVLQELIDDPPLWESIKNGQDKEAKKEAVRQATIVQKGLFVDFAPRSIFEEAKTVMQQMLGNKPGSCPVLFNSLKRTAFSIFSENSLTFKGSGSKDPDFCKVCPVCGGEINCVVRTGGSCPKCGATKRCG